METTILQGYILGIGGYINNLHCCELKPSYYNKETF